MPIYYLSDTNISTTIETLATSAPSSIDEEQGWEVNKNASHYKVYLPDSIISRAPTWSTTTTATFTQQGYRTSEALSGSFGSGNWTLAFKIKSNKYYTQQGTIGFKLWKSSNADGSSASEITAGWNRSSTFSFSAANQYQTGTAVWSAGSEVILSMEYLFLEIEIQCTSASSSNFAQVLWVHNEGSAESLTTPTYTAESWFQRIFWCG